MAKACCVANIPFGNINDQSFDEIWNGEPINKLRNRFAAGEKDNRCAHCINLEKSGATSIRQETIEKFADNFRKLTSPRPIYFDIRFSNVCNFKCRTCWHGASSGWFDDAKSLGTALGKEAVIENVKDADKFIAELGPYFKQAKEIYFAGGEPLVTDGHYTLLEWLISQGTNQAHLRYNTNFSILQYRKYDLLKLWSHFERVELMVSLDDMEENGEYIRSGMKWETILRNREKIRQSPHIQVKIAPTISILNVARIPELYEKCVQLEFINPGDFYINILERPLPYCIQILPESEKKKVQAIYEKWLDSDFGKNSPKTVKNQLQEVLDFMWEKDHSKHWQKFQKYNGQIDIIRNEKWPTSWTI